MGTPRPAPDLLDVGEEAAPVQQAGELVDVGEAAQEPSSSLRAAMEWLTVTKPPSADLHKPRTDLDRLPLPVARDVHGLEHEDAGLAERPCAVLHVATGLGSVDSSAVIVRSCEREYPRE